MERNDVGYMEWENQRVRSISEKVVNESSRVVAYNAIVVSVGSNTASVKLVGDETILPNLKNKTHETLNIGDNVYLFSVSGNLTNSFIAFKF